MFWKQHIICMLSHWGLLTTDKYLFLWPVPDALIDYKLCKNFCLGYEKDLFTPFSIVSIVDLTQVSVRWVIANSENIKDLALQGHNLIKFYQICLNKLNSKEIHSTLIESVDSKPFYEFFTKKFFQNSNLVCKGIYVLSLIIKKYSRRRVRQYKLSNNVLYLNKMLFRFGKIDSVLYFPCKMVDVTPLHLFYNCTKTKLFLTNETNISLTQHYSFLLLYPKVPC